MSDYGKLKDYPDVSFIDNMTLQEVQEQLTADYQEKYRELTGRDTRGEADPYQIVLFSCGLLGYQTLQFLDNAAKQNFLKYAYEGFLDNLGAAKGVTRNPAVPARTTIRFTLSEPQNRIVAIPGGTRCTPPSGEVFFYTTERKEIPAGDIYVDIECECTESGVIGNDYDVGSINEISDPVEYVASVSNTTKTEGGADIEDDNSLSERIYLAPASYSVAGPEDAYIYFVKKANSEIGDVRVTSPEPCIVDIRFIMDDGSLPGQQLIDDVFGYISGKDVRPLSDQVRVGMPDIAVFSINLSYYISESSRGISDTIQSEVDTAIEEYIYWQTSVIGRDINPSELIKRVMQAGAKRVEVNEPLFTGVSDISIPNLTEKNIVYGGIEDD